MPKNIEFFDASKIPTPWPFPIHITGGKAHKVPPPPPVKVKRPPLEDAFL